MPRPSLFRRLVQVMRRPRWGHLLLLAALLLPLLWPLQQLAERYYGERLRERSQQTLALYVANLQATLRRFEVLPSLLSDLPELRQLLASPADPARRDRANALLIRVAEQTGAAVIYLLDAQGNTLATSNVGQADDFSGRNFAFRPYYRDAMAGKRARFFGLGTTSQRRGYYFADALDDTGGTLGVLVIKIDLEDHESLWGQSDERLLVTDARGVVILSSHGPWRFLARQPLGAAQLAEIARDQPYPSASPAPLALNATDWLEQHRPLPEAGWNVSILTPRTLLAAQVQSAVLIAAAALAVLLLLLGLLLQRRRHYLARIDQDSRARRELEQRVAERTADLQALNQHLREAVLEREAAQQQLVSTQDELVQAGKLSALGTMAASISHELNQPLAAIRSYADNASVLLDHGRLDDTRGNLRQISELTTRMASIISHLRAYARRDRHAPESVALQPALDDALALLAKRRRELNIELHRDLPEAPLWVQAGETRLRQILANLLGNALDALSERAPPRQLWLSTQIDSEGVTLQLRDNGPGFSAEALLRAREPFFTTKQHGNGLGLGLAICNNLVDALDGRLTLANHPQGGAQLSLFLRHAKDAMHSASHEDLPG